MDGNLVITSGVASVDGFALGLQPGAQLQSVPVGASTPAAYTAPANTAMLSQFVGADVTRAPQANAQSGANALGTTQPASTPTVTTRPVTTAPAASTVPAATTAPSTTTSPAGGAAAAATGANAAKAAPATKAAKPQPVHVTVQAGDTLSKIAAANGTTWQKLYAANKAVVGADANLIRPGQKLVVPGTSTKTTPPAAARAAGVAAAAARAASAPAAPGAATSPSPGATGAPAAAGVTPTPAVDPARMAYLRSELARTDKVIADGNRMAGEWYATLALPSTTASNRIQLNDNINQVMADNAKLEDYRAGLRRELGLAPPVVNDFAGYGLTR